MHPHLKINERLLLLSRGHRKTCDYDEETAEEAFCSPRPSWLSLRFQSKIFMVTPVTVRDGALIPVVICWPVKAVGAKNASARTKTKRDEAPKRVSFVRAFMSAPTCVDSSRPHAQGKLFSQTNKRSQAFITPQKGTAETPYKLNGEGFATADEIGGCGRERRTRPVLEGWWSVHNSFHTTH